MEVIVELHRDDIDQIRTITPLSGNFDAIIDSGRCTVSQLKSLAQADGSVSIHDILRRAHIVLPSPAALPARSAELDARIAKLRREQENDAYRRMVKNVDGNQAYGRINVMADFGREMQTMNRQMIAVFNTLITVGGAFVFGFFGITYAYPSVTLDFSIRMMIGLVLATIVFFADLYFIVKNMSIDETTTMATPAGAAADSVSPTKVKSTKLKQ